MQPPILLEVPKPCHEDWNRMTPEGRGRFCASCSKQVVDFSLMSDQQIIQYFSNTAGKTCGRFSDDQLKRPLIPVKEQKKQNWWIAMMLPMILLFEKANAQKKKTTGTKGEPAITRCEPKNEIMGKVAFPVSHDTAKLPALNSIAPEPVKILLGDTVVSPVKVSNEQQFMIKGKLTDIREKYPISFASVIEKGTSHGVSANADGNFELAIPAKQKNLSIVISAVGYESKEIAINPALADSNGMIELNEKLTAMNQALSGEVVVVRCWAKAKHVKQKDSLVTMVKKKFQKTIFSIYPNPVSKGSMMNIQFKKAGDYSIQILDNRSRLVEIKEYNAISDATVTTMQIPSTLSGGMYYVHVIDEKKKKQYTDKIIVE